MTHLRIIIYVFFYLALTLVSKLICLIFVLCHGAVLFVASFFFDYLLTRVCILIPHYAIESGSR